MIDVKDETWALAGMSVVRRRPWYLLVNCSTHDRAAGTGNAQSPIVDRWVDGTSVVGQSTDSRRRRAADLWYVCRRLSVCLSNTPVMCRVHNGTTGTHTVGMSVSRV